VGWHGRACVDHGVHVKVVGPWSVSRAVAENYSWYSTQVDFERYTYLWFMQVGSSRKCATGATTPADCDASSVKGTRSDGLKKTWK